MIREQISKLLAKTLATCGFSCDTWTLEHPSDTTHGDYATNVALIVAQQTKQNPKHIAEQIVAEIQKNLPKGIKHVDIAGPGFINFYLSRDFFTQSIKTILEQGEAFGKNNTLTGKKVMVEYTDPNVMKPFHIGHLMSNAIGESLARIYEWNGAEVKRANYFSDVGLGIAKAVWGMQDLIAEMPTENASIVERTDFLGRAYVHGVAESDTHEAVAEEIKTINKKLYDRSDEKLNGLYDMGRRWSLEHFEKLYAILGSTFDYFYPESAVAGEAQKIVEDALAQGIFEKSDGAVIFRGENVGLHTRVFINALGIPTYEAKELALNTQKQRDYPADVYIIITASEQNEYFKVVLKALEQIDEALWKKMKHISHGMMTLTTGKMSSRKGNVVTGESLIQDMTEASLAIMGERVHELGEHTAEMIAVGGIKYSILKQGIGKNIVFDPNTSLSFDGDSGPYLQYAVVRGKALLEKAQQEELSPRAEHPPEETTHLERLLYRFPEVVAQALDEHAPHELAQYATMLASAFNTFYAGEKIIGSIDGYASYRLALVEAIHIVLRSSLTILGIRIPEKM